MRETAGGILGSARRPRPRARPRPAWRNRAAARALARGGFARDRRVVARGHGSDRPRCLRRDDRAQRAAWADARIWLEGRRAKQERQEIVAKKVRAKPKTRTADRADDREGRGERARGARAGARAPGAAVRARCLERAAGAVAARRSAGSNEGGYSAEALEAMSRLVEIKLNDFGVEAEVVAVHPGPVVTRFELKPAPGVKSSQISNLAKDLARSLATVSVRVVEIIPGKPYVGLEIPNEVREIVALGEIVKSQAYDELKSPLTLALGKDIGGQPMCADLARMPHLLIAGTTGSGKSVALNAMVLSLLYKVDSRARAADHDRPEDARAVGVRRHPASARARRHGHEAGRERVALVRCGNGAPLRADGGSRRAPSFELQQEGVRSDRERQAAARSDVQAGDGARADGARSCKRCRSSSSSSTSSPT